MSYATGEPPALFWPLKNAKVGLANVYQVSISNPTSPLTTMFRSGATSASKDSMTITDSITAAGTGHQLSVQTAAGSSVKPIIIANNSSGSNGVEMDTAGNVSDHLKT